MNQRMFVLIISAAVFGVAVLFVSGLLNVSANKASDSINSINSISQPTSFVPQPMPSSEQAGIGIIRIDDPRIFRDIQVYPLDPQIVANYPALQKGISEADKIFEATLVIAKNSPCSGLHVCSTEGPYSAKIHADVAWGIVSDERLHFHHVSDPNNPDVKTYGSWVRIGNAVYQITVYYI